MEYRVVKKWDRVSYNIPPLVGQVGVVVVEENEQGKIRCRWHEDSKKALGTYSTDWSEWHNIGSTNFAEEFRIALRSTPPTWQAVPDTMLFQDRWAELE